MSNSATPPESCCDDLSAILAAWQIYADTTNGEEVTEETCEEAHRTFHDVVQDVAVKNGLPGQPYPRRRP